MHKTCRFTKVVLTYLWLIQGLPRYQPKLLLNSCRWVFCKSNKTKLIKADGKWGGNINKQMKNSTYISVTFEKTQKTPCHESPQGSPPKASHFSRGGKFREIYKLFRAITEEKKQHKIKMRTHMHGLYQSNWLQNFENVKFSRIIKEECIGKEPTFPHFLALLSIEINRHSSA